MAAENMADTSHTIHVKLKQRSYSIEVGRALLDDVGRRIALGPAVRRALIISDANVAPLYADRVTRSLLAAGIEPDGAIVPAGEASKSLETASGLYDRLAARRHERDEPIIALGGGMVGDLAGFVAATWMRGVPVVQCPTTLEADIDASVGGKTAVNHGAGKNLIGAFHQPRIVIIDVDCLTTLSDRDLSAGLAESVKHALLSGDVFLRWHEENAAKLLAREPDQLLELIRRNCEFKAAVVETDEREASVKGVGRAALNFGHTVAHAIETQFGHSLRHGECVALGMVAELFLAERLGIAAPGRRLACENLLSTLNLPTRMPRGASSAALIELMRGDKKAAGGVIRFVVPDASNTPQWVTTPDDKPIEEALRHISPA